MLELHFSGFLFGKELMDFSVARDHLGEFELEILDLRESLLDDVFCILLGKSEVDLVLKELVLSLELRLLDVADRQVFEVTAHLEHRKVLFLGIFGLGEAIINLLVQFHAHTSIVGALRFIERDILDNVFIDGVLFLGGPLRNLLDLLDTRLDVHARRVVH
eukprot:CAMPEP_0170555272 /NCGR_PEP_ID=MMETSP0211-20121228/13177_1 /TAXON_ID=311385 /ORGANISM="Pseudokeronopsis sp., Strain OXSARD2" /LENGTH=160 /DNA_ID=CAMNT_0010865003 /DNA_START=1928 /DNA_END=2410 /DNA_ORIENTATION=-